MNNRIFGLALFALTLGAVIYYPKLQASNVVIDDNIRHQVVALQRPVVDVVFVLDTTGSMSGLIDTAKEKIWSIASTMASAQPAPDIRIGLVGYRDRGDAYVTKVVDLNNDLDSVYATLMEFQAGGGGDTPESVNKALFDAVHNMSWSQRDQAYQVVFLVGDAPPHMDYNEVQYPEIIAAANEKGIVINTIQSGDLSMTVDPWTTIASLGNGRFFQVEQAGSGVAYTTPYDEEIADLAARLDGTRLYYGSEEDLARGQKKQAASANIAVTASVAARARRGKRCRRRYSQWRRKSRRCISAGSPMNGQISRHRSGNLPRIVTSSWKRKSRKLVASRIRWIGSSTKQLKSKLARPDSSTRMARFTRSVPDHAATSGRGLWAPFCL
jgi:Mg-chelatase subunit ChlD